MRRMQHARGCCMVGRTFILVAMDEEDGLDAPQA